MIEYLMQCNGIIHICTFSCCLGNRSKELDETRRNLARELLAMPSEQSNLQPNTSSSSGEKLNKKSKDEVEAEDREKMQVLVSNFTEEQLDRYEMYRRATFPKGTSTYFSTYMNRCKADKKYIFMYYIEMEFEYSLLSNI